MTKVCRPVTEFNGRLHTLLDDMKDTLLDSGGVGLAAPQVGVLRRVCVVMNEDDEIIELINPRDHQDRGRADGPGGLPERARQIRRRDAPKRRCGCGRRTATAASSTSRTRALTARCFCHEIEHLDGHLFVEHTDHLLTDEELQKYIDEQEGEA